MNIAIDGYEANVLQKVGISRYAFGVISHIYACVLADVSLQKTFRFVVYLPTPPLPDMPKETAWWRYIIASPVRFWTFIGLPLAISRASPKHDLVFSPTHYIPRFITTPKVAAVMDLGYLEFPDHFRQNDLYKLINWTAYSITHAKRVLTISEFSRNAILEKYRIPKERVVVTYPGLDIAEKSPMKTVNSPYHPSKNYILSVGTLQPRKNYIQLIRAFADIRASAKQNDLDLLIVGKKGWLYEEILAAPAAYGVTEHVKFLDFVPDSDLPLLYKEAICFALPSLYEGFGLPVLEAMSYGCPVVVSNVSSLPEIAGDAGILVDPTDVQSIVSGLNTALAERGTKKQKERIALGQLQAKKFTWEKAAKDTLHVFAEIGGVKI